MNSKKSTCVKNAVVGAEVVVDFFYSLQLVLSYERTLDVQSVSIDFTIVAIVTYVS